MALLSTDNRTRGSSASHQARRGEAFTIPPAGYELDEADQWVLSSDEAMQGALRRVFEKFDELGAAWQVYLWWRSAGLPFPMRRTQPRAHPIGWVPISYRLAYLRPNLTSSPTSGP